MASKKCISIALIPTIILIIGVVYVIAKVDYNDKMPTLQNSEKDHSFHIINHLNGLSDSNLINTFPYKVYLDSINIYDVIDIKKSTLEIDTVSKDNMLSQQIVSIALTDSLLRVTKNKYVRYNSDSLILLMQWVEKFKNYGDIDKQNKTLYQAIHDFWMNVITNNLTDLCKHDYWLKYDYKFKYLSSRLEEKGFNTTVGFNDAEKVLNNIIENNYSYLVDRFISRTSIFIKIFFLFAITLTIYGYYCIYKFHKK